MVRVMLSSRGVPVRPQVHVPGVGRVDLLVGESLIIECDSEEHHAGIIDKDRRRDMMARRLGYTVVRLSWQQVWCTWEETRAFLADLIRTRRHLMRPRPLPTTFAA